MFVESRYDINLYEVRTRRGEGLHPMCLCTVRRNGSEGTDACLSRATLGWYAIMKNPYDVNKVKTVGSNALR